MAEKMDLNEKLRILMEDKECVDLSKTFTDMQMIKVVVLKTLLLESLEYAAENRGVTKIRNLPKLHNGETHEYHLTKDHVRFVLRFISGSLKGESVNFQPFYTKSEIEDTGYTKLFNVIEIRVKEKSEKKYVMTSTDGRLKLAKEIQSTFVMDICEKHINHLNEQANKG